MLTEPLFSPAFTSTSYRMPNADLLTGIFLLEPLKGIHVKFASDGLPLFPSDLLLFYGAPELLNCISLSGCETVYIVKSMLDQDIDHSLGPEQKKTIQALQQLSVLPKTTR